MNSLFASWQFLIAISIITFSFSTILQRVLMKDNKSDSIAFSILFQILAGVIVGIFALFHGFQMPNLVLYIPNIILMIILYSIANIFIFKSLQLIEASEFTILFVSRAFWTILAAVVLLGEKFLLFQVVGTLFVLGGVILVSYKAKRFIINKGSLYALLGACALGLAFTNDAFLVRHFDVLSYEAIAFILPGLAIMAVFPKSLKRMKPLLGKKTLPKILLLTFIYAISGVTIFLAYQVGRNAAQLGALSQLSTIFTVLLAIFILKETSELWKKMLGSIIAFIGVVLIG